MTEHTNSNGDDGHSESAAYETRDIRLRPLIVFMAGLTVLIVFSFLVAFWAFRLFNARHAAEDAKAPRSTVARPVVAAPADEQLRWPEPRVQTHPADDLKAQRAAEEVALTTYAWVDRANGVVRVPVDVAMQLVLKDGLPAAQSAAPVMAPGGAEERRKSP